MIDAVRQKVNSWGFEIGDLAVVNCTEGLKLKPFGHWLVTKIQGTSYSLFYTAMSIANLANSILHAVAHPGNRTQHFMFILDCSRFFALLYVPVLIKNLFDVSTTYKDKSLRVMRSVEIIGQIYKAVIGGVYGIFRYAGTAGRYTGIFNTLFWFGSVFGTIEVGLLSRKIALTKDIEKELDISYKKSKESSNWIYEKKENLIESFSDEKLMEYFMVPPHEVSNLRENAKRLFREDGELGNDKIYAHLKERVSKMHQSNKYRLVAAVVSVIGGVFFTASMLTPAAPVTVAIAAIGYAFFALSSATSFGVFVYEMNVESLELESPSLPWTRLQELS